MEMSEMIATANAKSIEEIKSFLSKQKETYKIPYPSMNFNHEELMLMMLYSTCTRLGLIHELRFMQCHLMPDETALRELSEGVIEKLKLVTDAEFAELEFPLD